ncbi:WD40/YVTN/BNR-like repeat-containing protein [Nocardia aurantiaca]|uniref:Sialidase domain-containing protein n=1 Tax=Nocardia aurantiaca TaxID=2675850 RepID=A0A6I3KXM4_9NOCA|nr:hypothetical protein [Nocardia aurantiaca]MTE14221.1 hypothetical protein [Nocardia aurantiaca]
MGLRANPVVVAGVIGVGVPVLAAGLVAGLTINTGETGPDATTSTSEPAATGPATTATALPSPTATTAVEPEAVGFQPDSITFITAEEGWVLGRVYPCDTEPCRALRHTTDGGRTWQQAPLPAPLRTATKTGWVKFADAHNGWIRADSKLFSTHDGGTTWRPVDLDVNAVVDAWTLSVSEDGVHIAAAQPGEKTVLFSSPLTSDSWSETTDIPVASGGGPDPSASVTVIGSRAWLVVANRTQAGARLVDGTWSQWKLPCGGNGPADWHALSERRVLALCGRPGPGTNDTATTHLMTSTDGGVTFTETGQLAATLSRDAALVPADATHLVAALGEHLLTSTDGGATWTTTYTAPDQGWTETSGSFVSDTNGFVIMTRTGAEHHASILLATQDAGRTWTPVTLG